MAFNATNAVVVGLATKKDHYDRAFENGVALYAGETGIVGAAAGDDPYFSTATQLGAGPRQLRQTFRGLQLRTHPDADVAASKVFLAHADEIVLHDGTRVASWDNLTADITVSGAGGLDTGSEGASRWYSIHAIRKSSDGTKNLLLHRAKDYGADQANATNNADYAFRNTSATTKLGQEFQVTTAGQMPFVDLYCKKTGSPTGVVYATIEADSGGFPSGTPLATSDKIDASLLPTSNIWVRFVFRSPATLAAATAYHLVLNTTVAINAGTYLTFGINTASAYANGDLEQYSGTVWTNSAAGSYDLNFKTYITQNDTAVSMPTGYDQYAQVGWVYNDSGSNFLPMSARDRDVYHYQVAVSNVTTAVMTLTDSTVVHPPVPVVMTTANVRGSVAGAGLYISPAPSGNSAVSVFESFALADIFFLAGMMVSLEFQFFYFKTDSGAAFIYPLSYRW